MQNARLVGGNFEQFGKFALIFGRVDVSVTVIFERTEEPVQSNVYGSRLNHCGFPRAERNSPFGLCCDNIAVAEKHDSSIRVKNLRRHRFFRPASHFLFRRAVCQTYRLFLYFFIRYIPLRYFRRISELKIICCLYLPSLSELFFELFFELFRSSPIKKLYSPSKSSFAGFFPSNQSLGFAEILDRPSQTKSTI